MAWKTLKRANQVVLAPGDRILLKAGCEFAGSLSPEGSGAKGKPIVIDKYGDGPHPVVAGKGRVENTFRLHNQQYWEIRSLTITNTDGGDPYSDEGRQIRRAIYITAEDAGGVKHIHLENLEIRDVRGMYRFAGNTTNGGIICQVLGGKKPTRFVDLRIESCTFRTKSIDRYPVVVASSWKQDPACEVVWKDNRLDHHGRAHIVIPAREWPRSQVYYFCPECREVFDLAKTAVPRCPKCGRLGVEDIFSEMAARLKHAWDFFDATRYEKGRWGLFKVSPGDKGYTLWASAVLALGTYGEMRCMGFEPPGFKGNDKILNEWVNTISEYIDPNTNLLKGPLGATGGSVVSADAYVSGYYASVLRNRVFMADRYQPPVGTHADVDHLKDPQTALNFLEDKDPKYGSWAKGPWGKGSWTTRVIKNHVDILKQKGIEPNDDRMLEFAHHWLDNKQNPRTGAWGGEQAGHHNTVNGIFKVFVSYERYHWPIQYKKQIVDFVLSGADQNKGFAGSGCSVFDPMMVLSVIRNRGETYRAADIDRVTAKTFLTFLDNWDEKRNWYRGNNWNAKHNNAIPMYMAGLILDQPYFKISTIYNWREKRIITRGNDGNVTMNKAVYQTRGQPFGG
jgi:hypothetical protein